MYANQIRELRQTRGIPPTELAYRTGLSTSTLFAYERGEREPSLGVARAIARVLNAPVDDVFPEPVAA